jgi:Ca2+-binding RTX toxin-like protein
LQGQEDSALTGNNLSNKLKGNTGDNALKGGAGNDKIYGGDGDDRIAGGTGRDSLVGGNGKDQFLFADKPAATTIDTISDFSVKDDTITLDDDAFTKIGKVGKLTSDAFHIGTRAADKEDRIIYDSKSGKLWYDADGTGSSKAIEFAILDKALKTTATDFVIVS